MNLLSFRPRGLPAAREHGFDRFDDYRRATRHPLPCLIFLLPLLVAYEVGVWHLGGAAGAALRNGADSWLRWALESFGMPQLFWAPALVALFFLIRSWLRRHDFPDDLPGVCVGMAIESLAFGLGLWVLSRLVGPLAEMLRLALAAGDPALPWLRVVTYVGAGVYEEICFRLVLYSGLIVLFRLLRLSTLLALLLAAGTSAALFAAAHHVGPFGEPFDDRIFLFRAIAGLYFAGLYQLRGFGIAVGAHVFYDVLVGVALPWRG